jgi:hypothetical protein
VSLPLDGTGKLGQKFMLFTMKASRKNSNMLHLKPGP